LTASTTTLYRTATGTRLHIRECPHLLGKEVFEATEGEICDSCERELRGEGRTYFDRLADALALVEAPQGNWPLIEQHLAAVDRDRIWVPFSRSYVALGRDGRAVAWAGRTYVVPAAGEYIELPGFRSGSGGGAASEEIWGATCEKHHLQRARNGSCWMCED
jgi:hypothetical protein